jgi:hypothetical protein
MPVAAAQPTPKAGSASGAAAIHPDTRTVSHAFGSVAGVADLEALRYRHDELRRALDIQRETVDILHGRANVILVAGLSVSAFLGNDVADKSSDWALAAGVAALAVTMLIFVAVLRPRGWQFYPDPERLADPTYDDDRLTVDHFLGANITSMRKCNEHNAPAITKVSKLIVAEAIAASATSLVWLALALF